nr:hypothetical protein [Solirubrobacterales bacterium]
APAQPAPVRGTSQRPPASPVAERRSSGGARGFFIGLVIVALLAAGGIAAYLATTSDERGVNLRRVTADQVDGIVDELGTLIDDNTR